MWSYSTCSCKITLRMRCCRRSKWITTFCMGLIITCLRIIPFCMWSPITICRCISSFCMRVASWSNCYIPLSMARLAICLWIRSLSMTSSTWSSCTYSLGMTSIRSRSQSSATLGMTSIRSRSGCLVSFCMICSWTIGSTLKTLRMPTIWRCRCLIPFCKSIISVSITIYLM